MDTPTLAMTESVQAIIDQQKEKPGALLPILHAIQDQFGYIPTDTISLIATAMQQTAAEIHGVISFYRHFHTNRPGSQRVEICRAEACQARGCRSLEAHAKDSLKIDYHQTTADRNVTLDPVYCLGNCASGPNIRVGNDIIANVSAEKFDRIIDKLSTSNLTIQ